MKYFDMIVVVALFLVGVLSSGFSVENPSHENKGIYYDHFKTSDNVSLQDVDGLHIHYDAELTNPGDYYELYFDVVNSSGVDVKVEDFSVPQDSRYITYDFSYQDGHGIQIGDLLNAGERKRLRYRVTYKNPIDTDTYSFDTSFVLHFEQVL